MKETAKNIIVVLSILLLTGSGIIYLSHVTERKDSRNKFADFYSEEKEYQVLFLGSSHVLNGIFPMELWNNYGITSYNLAGHGNRMALNYWILKNALEYKKPKLVVVDTFMIGGEDKIASLEQLHISVDHFPYSRGKVEMIQDLVEEEDRRKDFLFKFSTYHHRWNEVTKEDLQNIPNVEKGAESRINVAKTQQNMVLGEEEVMGEKTLNMEYLDKIASLCKEQHIELLLTYLPFPDATGWRKESNTVKKIAKEQGIDFLDYDTLYSVVDFATDYYDKDSHLNPLGAKKITDYIGNYLINKYHLSDYRDWKEYNDWWEDYRDYYQYKMENIKKEEELKNVLMLLNDKNISYGIYFKPWNTISEYPVLVRLLNSMGIDYSQIPKEDYFFIKDKVNNKESILTLFGNTDTAFGSFSLFYNEEGHLELSSSKAESMILTYSDIAVVVFNNYNLNTEAQKRFSLSEIDIEFMDIRE